MDFSHNALVFDNGYKGKNFVIFNPLNIGDLSKAPLEGIPIQLDNNSFWNDLISKAWSANCNYFITIDETGIIFANTKSGNAIHFNLSIKFFEDFLPKICLTHKKFHTEEKSLFD